MKKRTTLSGLVMAATVMAGEPERTVNLITLDPGHFHAGLVQKFMYPQVSPVVHVYAPGGAELDDHLKRVAGFNARAESPTRWEERVYAGSDYLDRMIREKAGNVVVISGNNRQKTDYINKSVSAGLNVLADKPMAINPDGFNLLRKAFDTAAKKKALLYDIMTERYEITTLLQRELAQFPDVFGTLDKGTPDNPSVIKESVHHYSKEVAGKALVRPAWFFDVAQQGEAVPDVGTHLVDLVQWGCFPEQIIDWKKDIKVLMANRWATAITPAEFRKVTGLDSWPEYLKKYVDPSGTLQVYQNGDVTYAIRGIHAKVAVMWKFEAPTGTKDTHFSLMRGSRASIYIRQGAEQKFVPKLYVEPVAESGKSSEDALKKAVAKLNQTYPGLELQPATKGWEIVIPEKYSPGHEAHFTAVTAKYLGFLKDGTMPEWEVPNMIAKYYTTTEAFKLGHSKRR